MKCPYCQKEMQQGYMHDISIKTYRTKRVDETRFKPLSIKALRRVNLFKKNFEDGQNVLIKTSETLVNKGFEMA